MTGQMESPRSSRKSEEKYEIEVVGDFEQQYNLLDAKMTRRVNEALERLAENPIKYGKKLKGKLRGLYSLRVGRYRITYDIDVQTKTCYVRNVLKRSTVYRR